MSLRDILDLPELWVAPPCPSAKERAAAASQAHGMALQSLAATMAVLSARLDLLAVTPPGATAASARAGVREDVIQFERDLTNLSGDRVQRVCPSLLVVPTVVAAYLTSDASEDTFAAAEAASAVRSARTHLVSTIRHNYARYVQACAREHAREHAPS